MIEWYKEPKDRAPCPACGKETFCWSTFVPCIYKREGCNWQGKDLELLPHLGITSQPNVYTDEVKKCQLVLVKCSLCSDVMRRIDLELHMSSSCSKRTSTVFCPNSAEGYAWSGRNEQLEHHLTQCDALHVQCEHCRKLLKHIEYDKHTTTNNECPNHHKGCNWFGLCKDLTAHLNLNPDKETWMNGCDYAKIKCAYCQHYFERHELKAKVQNIEKVLKINDLGKILAISRNARTKWYYIGLELSIHPDDLEGIKSEYHNKPLDCYKEMLQLWLSSSSICTEKKTWMVFLQALKSKNVGHEALSDDIAQGTSLT